MVLIFGFGFFCNRAPGDEWEGSCVGKAGEDNMSLQINTMSWHQCQQFLFPICFSSVWIVIHCRYGHCPEEKSNAQKQNYRDVRFR